MRLVLVTLAVSACACDRTSERELNEMAILDERLREYRDLISNREVREKEHAHVLARLEPFRRWPDDAVLAASIHPDASVSWKPAGFYRLLTLTAPGEPASAFLAAAALDAYVPGTVTFIRAATDSFAVEVGVVTFRTTRLLPAVTKTPAFDETAICFGECQARRAHLLVLAKEDQDAEAELGALADFRGHRQALDQILRLQGTLGKADRDALLRAIASAPWAHQIEEGWTYREAVRLRMKPTFEPGLCEPAVSGVATCNWTPDKRVLELVPRK